LLNYANETRLAKLKAALSFASQTGGNMKARSLVLTVALCVLGVAAAFAENPNIGTWKLNEGKSKLVAGMLKNNTVVYSMEGDSFKVTTDGTSGDGAPMHTEWTGKFDDKDYPLTGDSSANSRSYHKINEHTMTLENKKDGKVVASGKVVVSADGKSRTLTVKAKNADGKPVTSVAVYDKE
jgi:hypothetical protein